ncbi:phage baseplate assembly protein V [Sinobacterium caligoides]|uniref:Phage baseplate assembly protein V n=1 Tax=Sinobacterium caligoides TaxID=933926 RepID=A0A3N2E0Q5_9GAMM|nr:phage baseplate assembly protein V [Sinobacterium caligoides]ROS05711.1 phage baseplate assembly protein V [Sinobacterium caligoides]
MTQQLTSDIQRRLSRMVRVGTISGLAPQRRYKVDFGGGVVSHPLRQVVGKEGGTRVSMPLEVGEQVVVVAPNGDTSAAFILGSIYKAATLPTIPDTATGVEFSDGSKVFYDIEGNTLTIDAPMVKITGNLNVVGGIHSDADVSDAVSTMAEMRATYNKHDHAETNSITKPPNQKM